MARWIPTLGDGLFTKASLQPTRTTLRGLFADRGFNKNEIICQYGGTLIPVDQAFDEERRLVSSRMILLQDGKWVINAMHLRETPGTPAASFAKNHEVWQKPNVVFWERPYEESDTIVTDTAGKIIAETSVFLVSTRKLFRGDEILIDPTSYSDPEPLLFL